MSLRRRGRGSCELWANYPERVDCLRAFDVEEQLQTRRAIDGLDLLGLCLGLLVHLVHQELDDITQSRPRTYGRVSGA